MCFRVTSSNAAAASVPSISVMAPIGSLSGSVIGTSEIPASGRSSAPHALPRAAFALSMISNFDPFEGSPGRPLKG